jgi:hypothetical protein
MNSHHHQDVRILLVEAADGSSDSLRTGVAFLLKHRMVRNEQAIISWNGIAVPNLPHLQRPASRDQLLTLLTGATKLVVLMSGTRFDDWLLYGMMVLHTDPRCEIIILRDTFSSSMSCLSTGLHLSIECGRNGVVSSNKRPLQNLSLTANVVERVHRFLTQQQQQRISTTTVTPPTYAAVPSNKILQQIFSIHPATTAINPSTHSMNRIIVALEHSVTACTHRWISMFVKDMLGTGFAVSRNVAMAFQIPAWILPNFSGVEVQKLFDLRLSKSSSSLLSSSSSSSLRPQSLLSSRMPEEKDT